MLLSPSEKAAGTALYRQYITGAAPMSIPTSPAASRLTMGRAPATLYKYTIPLSWNFQQQFLRRERKLMTVLSCPKCGILKQGVPEDLDEFAEEILEEM